MPPQVHYALVFYLSGAQCMVKLLFRVREGLGIRLGLGWRWSRV